MQWPPELPNIYYSDDAVCIVHADCREILPLLPDKSVDLVLTDPPYGIGKAEWDKEFVLWWLDDVMRIGKRMGILCGTWNLLKMPERIGKASYRWTLAAHLINGMTRGRMGFGNWIPCVVYGTDYSSTPFREASLQWCRAFGDWCRQKGITNNQLDKICGTASMGDWWTGRSLPWCRIPSHKHWAKIKATFSPPEYLDNFPHADLYDLPLPRGDCKDFVIGGEVKPGHPTPKPPAVISWFLDVIGGHKILDPFLGSGTTAVCAKKLGRKCIGIEISEEYCHIAATRCSQAVMSLRPL